MYHFAPVRGWVLSLWLFAPSCLLRAGEFRLTTRPIAIPERGTVTGYVLHSSSYRFTFLPPRGWAIKENRASKTVVMMAPDLASSISFKHVPSLDDTNASASAEQYRAHVLTAYPEARIKAEFVCYTSDREGWAFDLEQSTSRKVKIAMRLAFIPVGNDQLEFKLTTGPEKFSRHQFAFNNFLTSFRTESVRSGRTAAPVADPRKAFFDQSLFEFAYHGSTNCSH